MDPIQQKFVALGGAGFFGKPLGQRRLIGHAPPAMQNAPHDKPETHTIAGWAQDYEKGSIYAKGEDVEDAAVAYAVMGVLNAKFIPMHGPLGGLGFPVADPVDVLKDGGRLSRFEHGVITLQPGQGAAHVLLGDMAAGWAAAGGLKGPGYPLSDAVSVASGAGEAVACSSGAKVFHKPALGAYEVHGKILDFYLQVGGPGGNRGFPIANTQTMPTGQAFSDFENGVIALAANGSHAFDVTPFPEVAKPQPGQDIAFGSQKAKTIFDQAIRVIREHIPSRVNVLGSNYNVSIVEGPRADTKVNLDKWEQRSPDAPLDPKGPISDYARIKGTLFNRGYLLHLKLDVDNPGPDVTIGVDVSIALALNRALGRITALPVAWDVKPDIPGLVTFAGNAFGHGAPTDDQIRDAVNPFLQNLADHPIPIANDIPPIVSTIKTRTNGALHVFLLD
ncbi:LGFP repeat-containing protein [Ralstonia pseudosolanacearum]|uniref:LGFP repeat-containing protein n=1 Tax=Ralstonia pseudosolanacearum TaxID=1310165 RepID=UPI0006769656|nr:hypothetical protein [Ralstonia pseudosolanacearum]